MNALHMDEIAVNAVSMCTKLGNSKSFELELYSLYTVIDDRILSYG